MLKRCVLRSFLKIPILWQFRILSGNEFHNVGAETENALKPHVRRLKLLVSTRFFEGDLNVLFGSYGLTNSLKYNGAMSCKHLKVKRIILKLIRCSTGRLEVARARCSRFVRGRLVASLFHRQPIQFPQNWWDMLISFR